MWNLYLIPKRFCIALKASAPFLSVQRNREQGGKTGGIEARLGGVVMNIDVDKFLEGDVSAIGKWSLGVR
jgi:hypothetical protein